ncbi:MAG: hypothetical protein EAZ18_26185, partial [Oscillatoriales cyanobacterium]
MTAAFSFWEWGMGNGEWELGIRDLLLVICYQCSALRLRSGYGLVAPERSRRVNSQQSTLVISYLLLVIGALPFD